MEKKLRKKTFVARFFEVCANTLRKMGDHGIRTDFIESARQKFLRSFFQKATSPVSSPSPTKS